MISIQTKQIALFITLLVSLTGFNLSAQKDSLYVYRDGKILFRQSVDKIDSITFVQGQSEKMLNLHVENKVVFEKSVSGIDSIHFASEVQPPLLLTGKNWMKGIADDTYLRNISIPGTHDSGALINVLGSQCQDWDVQTQLNNGVRFLDVRFVVKDGKLKVYHGIIDMKIGHDELFETIMRFLTDNPSETVIVSIKNENNSENTELVRILDAHMSANSGKWFTGTSVPKLSNARGKMVLFRRYGDSSKGINMSGWPDNTVFTVSGGRVQDVYKGGTTDAKINEKWGYISSLLDEAYTNYSTKGGTTFYVNFCSASYSITSPRVIADKINPKLQSFMNSAAKGSWGWILMDFPTEALVKTIYQKNIQ